MTDEPTEIAIPTKQAQITPQPVSIRHLTELLREQRPKPHRYVLSTENCKCWPDQYHNGFLGWKTIAQDGKIFQRPPSPDRDQQTTGTSPPAKHKTTLDHVLNYYADENHRLGPNKRNPHPTPRVTEVEKVGKPGPSPDPRPIERPSTSLSIKGNTWTGFTFTTTLEAVTGLRIRDGPT